VLLVALIELQKLENRAQVVFNNLHSRLQDLSTVIKLKKKNPWKETKFGATQVKNIILPHWFLIDPIL
jgi:hypothetical protein